MAADASPILVVVVTDHAVVARRPFVADSLRRLSLSAPPWPISWDIASRQEQDMHDATPTDINVAGKYISF